MEDGIQSSSGEGSAVSSKEAEQLDEDSVLAVHARDTSLHVAVPMQSAASMGIMRPDNGVPVAEPPPEPSVPQPLGQPQQCVPDGPTTRASSTDSTNDGATDLQHSEHSVLNRIEDSSNTTTGNEGLDQNNGGNSNENSTDDDAAAASSPMDPASQPPLMALDYNPQQMEAAAYTSFLEEPGDSIGETNFPGQSGNAVDEEANVAAVAPVDVDVARAKSEGMVKGTTEGVNKGGTAGVVRSTVSRVVRRSDSAPPALSGGTGGGEGQTQMEAAAALAALSTAASATSSPVNLPPGGKPDTPALPPLPPSSSRPVEQQQQPKPQRPSQLHHRQNSYQQKSTPAVSSGLKPTHKAASLGAVPHEAPQFPPRVHFRPQPQQHPPPGSLTPSTPPLGVTPSAASGAPAPGAAIGPDTASGSGGVTDRDAFPNSPRGQSNIVERSPGGRYVRFLEKLGSGAYKDVYRAYDTIEGIEVAWNVVNLSGMPKTERSRIVNEVRLLERLHHQNIISFHGSWVNRELEQVIFVTEILSSGTLKSFINKVQVIRWKIAKRWAVQILKGLEYLHSHDPPIIHRDLKCDNIFINGTSGDLRIGDLGLSTMISNKNQARSVLGTPEFMAPELYDEVYDERVDIYAFGMCLLEIFTKEIPYRECTNPAQIYRKVSMNIPPESLSRVRSPEARDFIRLCLGTRDSNGGYTRPSASELLRHPFLAKGADDESEVEVDPPLRERSIAELPVLLGSREGSGDSVVSTFTNSSHGPSEADFVGAARPPHQVESSEFVAQAQGQVVHGGEQQQLLVKGGEMNSAAAAAAASEQGRQDQPLHAHAGAVDASWQVPNQFQQHFANVSDDEESDHFQGMPDSELNIRKVKVFMGRGQELEDDDEEIQLPQPTPITVGDREMQLTSVQHQHHAHAEERRRNISRSESVSAGSGDSSAVLTQQPQYLVAAAVIQEETVGEKPYPNDILKLMITLPVDGQTQNVQFDFHLVEDDPVQVAREMVTELDIPHGAVLEISETISGLSRAARMEQDRYRQQKQQQETLLAQQQSLPQHSLAHQPRVMVQQLPPRGQAPNIALNQRTAGEPTGSSSLLPSRSEDDIISQQKSSRASSVGEAPMSTPQSAAAAQLKQKQQRPPPPAVTVDLPAVGLTGTHHQQSGVLSSAYSTDASIPAHRDAKVQHQTGETDVQQRKQTVPVTTMSNELSSSSGEAAATHQNSEDAVSSSEESESDEESDNIDSEELRRLEEDFQKNILRAKKAFDTRMDNLHRSKEEKEAQHLKTLEKHEKERAEFEKRVRLAEEEQNRRLEELEQQWARQRESLMMRHSRNGARRKKEQPRGRQEGRHRTVSGGVDSMSGAVAQQAVQPASHPLLGQTQPVQPASQLPIVQPPLPKPRHAENHRRHQSMYAAPVTGTIAKGSTNGRERTSSGSKLSSGDNSEWDSVR